MKLWEYSGKRVRITDIDGQIFMGFADYYISELDNPDGIATLSIIPDDDHDILISFEESEIAAIEIIFSNTPAVPLATAV